MDTDRNVESVMTPLTHSGMSPKWMGLGASKLILSSRADSFGPRRHDEHRKNQDLLVDCSSLIGDFLEPDPSLVFFLYYNSAKPARAGRIIPGARLCARSTSRSGVDPRDASDSSGCVRRFGAAAAGPRRTQPRSLGCCPAALCSSCLCGFASRFN